MFSVTLILTIIVPKISGHHPQDVLSRLQIFEAEVFWQRRDRHAEQRVCHGQRKQRSRSELRRRILAGRILRSKDPLSQSCRRTFC